MRFTLGWLDTLAACVLLLAAIYAIVITLMTLAAASSLLPWASHAQ